MIDWTEASVTDLARGFVPQYLTFGKEDLEKLIMYYGETEGYVWANMVAHVIELAETYPLDIAEFALKSGLDEYEEMAKSTLGVQ
ncbi:hypothetical protein [Salsuginibacillus kocurii]|uniref:hypothetical protein n=1 Tax=Salsuginibacillus kocurii TaxID=427078 RepID=UPI00037E773C|nr:hypothetical protein [Salsuginibacillus kocurii]